MASEAAIAGHSPFILQREFGVEAWPVDARDGRNLDIEDKCFQQLGCVVVEVENQPTRCVQLPGVRAPLPRRRAHSLRELWSGS